MRHAAGIAKANLAKTTQRLNTLVAAMTQNVCDSVSEAVFGVHVRAGHEASAALDRSRDI